MSELRKRLTFANVVSVLALFVALGGSAIAINKIKANSVGSKQLKAQAVKNSDLADNAVTSPKVANGSLLGEDFAAGQLPRGATGPAGPIGSAGATGPAGPTGTVNTSDFYDKAASDARFLGIGAAAANSNAIGGVPASAVPQSQRDTGNLGRDGTTRLGFARRTIPASTSSATNLLNIPSIGTVAVNCTNTGQPVVGFTNSRDAAVDVWLQDLTTNSLIRHTLNPGGTTTPPFFGATTTDAVNHVQIIVGSGDTTAGSARVAIFDVATVTKPAGANSCTFQVEGQSYQQVG